MKKELRVQRIKDGTVIDHIPPCRALNVLKILNVPKESSKSTVLVAINVPSKKMERKDIVKVEGRELADEEVDKIALIAPNATINIIRNYDVVEKKNVALPDKIEGAVQCANPNCITNQAEPVQSCFVVESQAPVRLRCIYCERIMEAEIIQRHI